MIWAVAFQGNEVTIFQPAREFLPAIQEVLYLINPCSS